MGSELGFKKEVFLVILGGFIAGLVGIGIDCWKECHETKRKVLTLHRSLFHEISDNVKLDQLMEFTSKPVKFETKVWEQFNASVAYYNMDADVQNKLNSLYSLFQFRNAGQAPIANSDEKKKRGLMATTEIGIFVDGYCTYLKSEGIIKKPKIEFKSEDLGFYPQPEQIQYQDSVSCINWHIKKNNGKHMD